MSRCLRGPYSKACTNCRKAKKRCSGCINTKCQRCIKKGLSCIPYKNNCKKIWNKHETCLELSSTTTTNFQSSYEDQQIENSEMLMATQNPEYHSGIFEIMHGNRENKHITDLIRYNHQPEKFLHSPVNEEKNNAPYTLHEDHETNYMSYYDISNHMYYGINDYIESDFNNYMESDIDKLMGLSLIPCADFSCCQNLNSEYADDSIIRFKNQDPYNDSVYVQESTQENSTEFKISEIDVQNKFSLDEKDIYFLI
ncbi:5216_t:CDS:2 [Acaulospora morrowiae]|uniref:5216_t:CDS:1 n=1 Tax=Acaulospora morrowiae TaxID=94023 RepID=A0A9N9A7B3_9GLOM|nr:5216_t:CDS:2 [Acaulospora morrowiae]